MEIIIKDISDGIAGQGMAEARMEAHDYYQILWFWQGVGSHHIDFSDEQVSPHKVFVVSPGQLYQFRPLTAAEGIVIQFEEGFFSHTADSLDTIIKYSVFNAFHRPPYYIIDDATGARLRDIADAFSREKFRLESIGQPIEDFDLLIGITAREKSRLPALCVPTLEACNPFQNVKYRKIFGQR